MTKRNENAALVALGSALVKRAGRGGASKAGRIVPSTRTTVKASSAAR